MLIHVVREVLLLHVENQSFSVKVVTQAVLALAVVVAVAPTALVNRAIVLSGPKRPSSLPTSKQGPGLAQRGWSLTYQHLAQVTNPAQQN